MERIKIDRPGRIIFLGGVVLVVAATALGLYLVSHSRADVILPDWHLPSYDERLEAVRADVYFLANVHALMWLTFGLGVTLTMLGLRMLTRPGSDPSPPGPIKPVLDAFEE